MREAIEDGSRQHFVASEQFGPVSDTFVGRDDHGTTAVAITDKAEEQAGLIVAITDKAEEQAGLIAVHRVVPHFVDQQHRTGSRGHRGSRRDGFSQRLEDPASRSPRRS